MAETIKGINIVLGADTTALSKALGDVNKRSRDIQSELRQVDKLLKLDPENTELLAQKQKLLSDAVSNTGEKLNRLKSAQEQVNKQFEKGEINEGQYRAFQREIAKTEQELRTYEKTIESVGRDTEKLSQQTDSAKKSLKDIGDSVSGVGTKLSAGLTAPIVGFAALATEGTKELRQDLSKLTTNAEQAGASIEQTESALRDLNAITGETDSNIEALSNLMQAGFTDNKLQEAVDALSGAVIKFPDTLKIEGLADGLQETLATGEAIGPFAELIDRMGGSTEEFNEALAAATTEAEKQQVALDWLAKSGLAEVNEAYRENNKELVENANAQWDLQNALAEIGALIEPIITQVISKVSEMLMWFNGLDEGTKSMILTIGGILAALGPVILIIGQVISAVSALAPVITALTGPIGIAVAAIAGLVAGLAILYNKNEEFRAFVDSTWSAIKDLFQQVWQEIVAFVKPIIEDLSKFFKSTFNELKEFWQTHGELIMAFIKPWLTGIVGFFKVTFEGIKTVISVAFTLIKNVVKTTIETVKLAISTGLDLIMGIVRTFAKLLKGDWSGAWEEIKRTASNIMDNIIQFFKNIDLVQVGKDIIGGLIKGIGSMAGAVVDTVKDVANGLVKGIKGALNINSPSKVTEQLGEWTGEGLVVGMKNTVRAVNQQANALAAAAVPEMQQIGSNGSAASINFEGFMSGAIFNVRSENDIKAIAREIFNLQQQALRGAGVR